MAVTEYWDQLSGDMLHKVDLDAIMAGARGNGVISGGVCSADGATLNIAVTALVLRAGGVRQTHAGGNVALSGGDATRPRVDLIIFDDSANALAAVEGTPTTEATVPGTPRPPAPDLPDPNDILLAKVYVPAQATAILAANVFNRRVFLQRATQTYTPTNVTTDRSYDADTVVVAELADVVGTLIADLQAMGMLD